MQRLEPLKGFLRLRHCLPRISQFVAFETKKAEHVAQVADGECAEGGLGGQRKSRQNGNVRNAILIKWQKLLLRRRTKMSCLVCC